MWDVFSEIDFGKRFSVLFSRPVWISATVPFYRELAK